MWRKAVPVLLILALTLAGCGTRKDAAQPEPAPDQQQAPADQAPPGPATYQSLPAATVRLTGWASSPAETAILEEVLKDFQAAYPNITVKYEPINADYKEKIQADFVAGTMADVYYLDVFWSADFMSRGLALPIDEYVAKYGVDTADFHASLLDGFKWQGKLYGLPKGYSTLGLFYSKKAFADAGITEPPKTWEDLRAVAQQLTTADRKGIVLAADHARFVPFIYAAGGKLFDPGFSQFYFDSPEAVKAMSFYTGLITKDRVADTPASLGAGWNGEAFAQGKAAMALEGHWMIPYLKEAAPDLDYGVAELPGESAKGNFVFTVAYAINAKSAVPEQAFALVDFLTSRATQEKVLRLGLELPSRKTASGSLAGDPLKAPLVSGAAYAIPFQYGVNMQETVDHFARAMEAIILEGADPQAKLTEVQQFWQSQK